MTVGTIVIDLDPDRTDSEICDDLLEHDVVIVEIGTRPTKMHRAQAISEELKQRPERWGKEEDGDVLFLTDEDGVGTKGVKAGIEKLTVEWRKRGRPRLCATHFEYDLEEDDDQA